MNGEIILTVKDEHIFQNLFQNAWHPILVDLLEWIRMTMLKPLPVITSAYRPGDKGVHGTDPLRAVDLRSHGLDAHAVCDSINEHWQYDSTRPKMRCAIFHDVGQGPHIHLQVHDRTCIVKGGWGAIKARRFVQECKI